MRFHPSSLLRKKKELVYAPPRPSDTVALTEMLAPENNFGKFLD